MSVIRRDYPEIAPAGPYYSRGVRAGGFLFIAGCTARGTEAQGGPLMDQLRVSPWTVSPGSRLKRELSPGT